MHKSARDVTRGDRVATGTVDHVEQRWGVVYIWLEGSDLARAADLIFNHGDPVTILEGPTS